MNKIDKLILGTVQFGLLYGINNKEGNLSDFAVNEILTFAAENGITDLDTAYSYGNAMERIGHFHKTTGIKFQVNTKFRIDTGITVSEQLQQSLGQLAIESVDTFFYHSFVDFINNPKIVVELNELKSRGYYKKTGVSIYNNDEFVHCINNIEVDVIQLPFNLLDNCSQRGKLIELAKKNKKEIQVRSVFLQGLFFMKAEDLPIKLLSLAPALYELFKIASELNINIEQLAMTYVQQQLNIDKIIIGVDSVEQLRKNVLDVDFKISEPYMKLISEILVEDITLLNPQNWK
jgi:aryl-alcohol dehydrogenase-like predicted oxidoreductase